MQESPMEEYEGDHWMDRREFDRVSGPIQANQRVVVECHNSQPSIVLKQLFACHPYSDARP
jgi:hypothetical protein